MLLLWKKLVVMRTGAQRVFRLHVRVSFEPQLEEFIECAHLVCIAPLVLNHQQPLLVRPDDAHDGALMLDATALARRCRPSFSGTSLATTPRLLAGAW